MTSGDIVGKYADNHGGIHGFLFRRGNFKTVDFPISVLVPITSPSGINARGNIVGGCSDADGMIQATILSAINDRGEILGLQFSIELVAVRSLGP
jgi:hypothetical protein